MTLQIIFAIAFLICLRWGMWQRERARSAEKLLDDQNELLEYQNLIINLKDAETLTPPTSQ